MKSVKVLTVILILLTVFCPLFARDLSLEEAVELAEKENLQLQSSKIDLEMAESAYKYSYNTFIPDANFTATFSKPNENTSGAMTGMIAKLHPGAPIPVDNDTHVAFTYGISGSWTFNPALITSIQIAKESYQKGEISYEQACAQLKQRIRKLYYGIVLQQNSLNIEENTLKSKEERYKQAKTDYENGYVPEISLIQSQVAYQNAKPSYEKAATDLLNSKRQLSFLLGLDINEPLNLTSSIEYSLIDVDSVEALSTICDRYDIRLIESEEQITKKRKAALIEQTFLPSIMLKASWQPYNSNIENNNWNDTGSLSATVAWNLTNLLPTSGKVSNLKDINRGLEKIRISKQMAEENARIEILNLLDKLNQAKSSLESSEGNVELAQLSYNMRQESYRTGTSDFLDLQDSETQLMQAKLGRLASQFDYISALIDLEYATGQQIF